MEQTLKGKREGFPVSGIQVICLKEGIKEQLGPWFGKSKQSIMSEDIIHISEDKKK